MSIVYASSLQPDTMELLYLIMQILASDLEDLDAISNVADDCEEAVTLAFERHGFCDTPGSCSFTSRDCDDEYGSCEDVPCLHESEDNCIYVADDDDDDDDTPGLGPCAPTMDIICCNTACANSDLYSAGGCPTESICNANCVTNVWSFEKRECYADLTNSSGCSACIAMD